MRNPWEPDDIIILIKFLCTYKAGKYLLELVKLWMEHRNAQRIEIKRPGAQRLARTLPLPRRGL